MKVQLPKNNLLPLVLLTMNLFVRLFVALNTNLIIDEAYYFTYAVAPGLSYFDHPPMVGQLILLTTLNLLYTGEIFLRLGPLVIGTINLLLIYLIGKELKDSKTGVLAMLMVSASAYHSIVAGTFILPDAPLSLFWLIAIFAAIKYIKSDRSVYIILFGVATGFAMLSKYHGVTLWFAMGLFILFRDRAMLRRPSVYLSAFLSLLLFMPVVIWNIDNQFVSFSFHSNRILSGPVKIHWIAQEIVGQFAYNNPIIVVILIMTLFPFLCSRKIWLDRSIVFLILLALPLPVIAIALSFTTRTLPHWSGIAYYALILISAVAVSGYEIDRYKKYMTSVFLANLLLFVAAGLVFVQLYVGVLPAKRSDTAESVGKNDVLLDLYGWDIAAEKLEKWIQSNTNDWKSINLVTRNWFPAGQLFYYYSYSRQEQLWVCGTIEEQHHFLILNKRLKPVRKGENMLYITTSVCYRPLPEKLASAFERVGNKVVIPIEMHGRTAYNLIIYPLEGAIKTIDAAEMHLVGAENNLSIREKE